MSLPDSLSNPVPPLNKLPDSQVFKGEFKEWDMEDLKKRITAIVARLRKARESYPSSSD